MKDLGSESNVFLTRCTDVSFAGQIPFGCAQGRLFAPLRMTGGATHGDDEDAGRTQPRACQISQSSLSFCH
jgi:hypothetical protein